MTDFYPEISIKERAGSPVNSFPAGNAPKVNGHIHTPYSFSAFQSMEQPFLMASRENISVLGINDFYTTDGYTEFAELAKKYRVFPLFNIEFMALHKEAQENGIRINDPQNPGRAYLSGKGLRYPVSMSRDSMDKIRNLQMESNRQTYAMVELLNRFLETTPLDIRMDAADIKKKLARNLLRERHIATAVRMAVFGAYGTDDLRMGAFTTLFMGKRPKSSLSDIASLENEIRNNLLKAGGPAFVPEDMKAFLSIEEIITLIRDAGGIPCYPVLLDDPDGNFTSFEADFNLLAESLKELGIYMIELIPGRNDCSILRRFTEFIHRQGFAITFGTEHNTPLLDPLTITCRGNIDPGEDINRISFRGSSVIAAHQYLLSKGMQGYPDGQFPSEEMLDELASLGKRVIEKFISA